MSDNNLEQYQPMSAEQERAILDTKEVLHNKEQVLKDLGQIEAFQFMGKLATIANLKIIQNVKESKAYKGLTYIDESGKVATIASFDDFCTHKLNVSRRQIDDDLLNLKTFGDDFFEASKKVGLTSSNLRKLRHLPEEDRLLAMQDDAIESGDKDAIRELIDDLHAKHNAQTKEIKSELSEVRADLSAVRKINTESAKREEELLSQIEKSKFTPADWPEKSRELITTTVVASHDAFNGLTKLTDLMEHINIETTNGENERECCEFITGVYMDILEQLAGQFALLMQDAESILPFSQQRKPSAEALQELADLANARLGDEEQNVGVME